MNIVVKHYRVARISYSKYEIQQWCLWFPFWIPIAANSNLEIKDLADSFVNEII